MANYGKEYKGRAKKALDKATSADGDFENNSCKLAQVMHTLISTQRVLCRAWVDYRRKQLIFDIHMGHLADKSYLSRAMFLVVSTTEQTNQQKTVGDPQYSVN